MKHVIQCLTIIVLFAFIATNAGWGQSSNAVRNKPAAAYPHDEAFVPVLQQAASDVFKNPGNSKTTLTISISSFTNGGNRLVEKQYTDGSWGWPLDAPPTYGNILGPIAMGLAQAYQQSGVSAQRTSLTNAGTYLLTKTNNFSPSDGYLAAQLDKFFGGTTYRSHVKTNFYDKLADGTYNRNGAGTLYNTASYVALIRSSRASQGIGNMAAWDIGMGLVGAAKCDESIEEWIAGTESEIDELDGDAYYDVIGLAGALYGLAVVDEEFDPTAGEHAAANSINDLAAILAGYQIAGGGFAWNSNYVIPNDGNETIQETGYSILALNEVNRSLYLTAIQGAADYVAGVQLGTGGWENYPGEGENNEVSGEALWGMSVAYPAPVHNITKDVYYPTIQGGVSDASAEDVITVAPGTYPEMVTITKSLTLLGAQAGVDPRGGARTPGGALESIIDGGSSRTEGILIKGASDGSRVENVTIDGFEIHHATYANVRFDYADNSVLKNTIVHHSTTNEGIKTKASCSSLLIQKVLSYDNVGDGIELGDYGTHTNHVIEDCEVFNNADRGIYLVSTSNTTIRRTKSYGNQSTVSDWHQGGIIAYQSTGTTLTDVECYNNAGIGIYLYKENYSGSTSSIINGNSLSYNNTVANIPGDGLSIYLSKNVTIETFESYGNARHGITIGTVGQYGDLGASEFCNNVIVRNSIIHNNSGSGIAFLGVGTSNCAASHSNSISDNTALGVNNATGILVNASSNWWGASVGVDSKVSANVDYTPWFNFAADTDPAVGFQGDYSTLSVSAASPQSGTTMRIQEAFDLVSGSTVNLTNGTYNEIINANKPDVSIIGNVADPAQVVINAGGLGGYGSPLTAIFVSASGISLKGFTLVGGGQAINSNPRYGIKFASVNNSTVEDLIVHDFYRAGIEFLTGSNIAVTDINAYNNGGTGLVVRDIQNAAISNITTDNNTWGGVRVQTSVTGVSGIVFSGINSFGENNQRNGGLYTEEDPPGIPVTYGYTSASQVQLQESDFEYSLLGNQDDPSPRVRFYKTLPQAGAAAIASPAPDHLVLSTAYIRNMVNNELYVEPGMKIQAAVNGAVSDDIIHVASATYSETITFAAGFAKNNLSILGSSPTKPVVNGGVLFQQSGSLSGLMFKDLYFMGAAPQNRVFNMNGITGSLDNFTLDACVIDGENVAGRHGIAGNKIGQAFTVTDCEFKNILGFAVLDMDASSDYSPIGANGLPLTMVTFANNTVENCNGSVAIRGHSTSKTPEVNVYGNNFDNIGGNQSQTGEQWAAMEINHALAANIYNNTIRHVSLGEYGEGQAFQFYDIGTLDMHDNTIMDNYQGIFVFGGGVSDPYGGPYATPGGSIYHNNISSNNQYGISIGSGVTGDPINATMNWWGHASGPLDNKSLPGTPNYNNPTGQGNSVSSLVDYKKWYADDGMTILAPFTITASAGEHGTIDPAGAIEVNYLDSKTFTITSTTDYHIADVLVDGISVGPVKTYNFASVIANHTISASFAINDVVYVSATGNDATGNGTSMYPYQTIGKGVSEVISGGIVNVGAGTFEEQVEIVKPLTLQGTGAGTTFIKSPTTLTKFFATSSNNFPVVYVHGVDNVTVQNLTVDGAGRGNANYRFIGIGYYNAGGTINACDVKDVRNTPIDGSQHGTAIYAYVDNSTSRTVNVSNNTMSGFQKNGMALNGNNLTATVTGNTITGAGAVDFIAQNGIQIGFGATGSITGNTVTGISYTPGTWVSTGILLYTPTGSIITSNNIVNQAQVGIYYLENGGEISDNTITATFAGIGNTSFWGIVADPGGTPRAKPQPFDEAVTANAKQQPKTSTAVIGTLVEGNTLTGDGTNGVALELDALGTETLNVTATNNTITGWAYGVYFYKEAGATLNATVNQNKIASNVVGAFDQTGVLQNAKNNWWGNASGPLDEKTLPGIPDYNNPDGLGNSVTSYVDYNPFYIDEGLTTLSTISISGMKFNDANGNGTKDPEDTGLSGWQITLTGGESPVTTTTDANGNYLFDNLQPRTYTVSEGLQTGWLQTTESPAPATLNPGQHLTNIDFGNFKLITISGMKFNDHDGDGVKDENDEGMAGWTINLSGTVTSSTTTDPTGAYSFTNLGPGTYTVTETVLDGWVQTSTNPTDITSVSGINVTDVNFGNFKKFSISGMKFEDTNGNGMKDGIEAGLSGWTINLTGAATSSTSTDAEGNYSFANLGPGTFTVSEVAQSGWAQSTSNPPNITGASGENVGNILFGNFKDAVISGMKFNDLDGDGVQDEGEAGLAGWTIRATKGASVKNTTTDAQGLYSISFTYSDAGQWTVSEVVQASWRQTYPASGTYSVLIQSGALAPNKTFGNYQLSSISGKKYDDMLGDSAIVDDQGINSWVIKLYQGTQMIGRQVTAGGGNYTFADLDPGTYIVQESLKTNWIQTYPKSGAGIVSPVADNNAGSRAYQIVITSGSAITQKDFANFNLGIISGVKFEDMDGDSVKETGDPLLASWVINLKKNGNVIDSDTTDLAGSYGFTGLTAGTYEVCEELQPDWYQTVPATPCYSFTVVSGSNFTGNIGNFEFGSIAGYKFFDHDSDGVNDSFSDDMMDSLKVVLVGTHTPPETVFTDANGAFLFDPVPADIYTIIEIPRAEWRQTFPANGANHTIQMMSNLDTSGFAFGNFYMPDTTRFRTFMVIDYNKSAAAKGKSNFIKKPNAGNVRDSVYLKLGFGLDTPSDSGYLRIGIQRYDSANFYGWLHYAYYYYRKAASTVGYHAGSVKNYIYNLRLSKPSRVQPKTNYLKFNGEKIAPTFFGNAGNHFTVELTTLKTNVAASDLGITPAGLGDLVFCRESGPDTILNGKTIRQIIACSDSALTFGLRNQDYWPLSKLILLDSVVTRINREFWKPFVKGYTFLTDTVSSSPLVVKGVKPLYKVAYLKRDPSRVTMLTRFAPVIANEETPLEYRLDQNYPNPFNPSTTIEFELAEPAIVSLSIFNVLGQKVATLLDHQEMIEGLQAVEFNAKDFASGVYFYRVDIGSLDSPEQNSFSSVKKMMLIK